MTIKTEILTSEKYSVKNDVLGHPKGLVFIVFTEAWERFSFYGMQALLVLYMTSYLFQPGNAERVIGLSGFRSIVEGVFGELSTTAFATQAFGLYIGLVYFLPILGGIIGDRFIGRKKAVITGGILMTIGHFLMVDETLFLFALAALILGVGFLKSNLAAQVGALYPKSDSRRDAGFSVYAIGINVGAFAAPLVCGTLGELYGWHLGFGAAGIGMLVALIIYIAGQRHLPPDQIKTKDNKPVKLEKGDGKIIAAILFFLAITALYWTAQTQIWNSYPLWVKERVLRDVGDFMIPITWFQSLDSFAVLLFAPFILAFWKRQSARGTEPSDLTKVGIGCMIFALACLWLSLGEVMSDGKVSLFWPVIFHFITGSTFLYLGPIILAVVSRAAPPAVNSTMLGICYLAIFFGGIFSGWLGRFYEQIPGEMFWLLHAGIVGTGSLLILLLKTPLSRAMKLEKRQQG